MNSLTSRGWWSGRVYVDWASKLLRVLVKVEPGTLGGVLLVLSYLSLLELLAFSATGIVTGLVELLISGLLNI